MGDIKQPLPVKLFVGVLTSAPELAQEAARRMSALFGDVDSESGPFPFDLTRYYNEDMGTPIRRYFYSFADLIEPSAIPGIKQSTNDLESAFAAAHTRLKRPVNLDPGYLEQSKIVLASTKNFYHRILVSGGIYAEVTLHYEGGRWRPFPWTFPDFKTDRYHAYFSATRELYRNQLSRAGVRIRGR